MIHIFERFFGCSHRKTTFPLSRKRASEKVTDSAKAAYVVCLDCGAEFEYDWHAMKIGKPALARPLTPPWNVQQAMGDLSAAMMRNHPDQHAVSN